MNIYDSSDYKIEDYFCSDYDGWTCLIWKDKHIIGNITQVGDAYTDSDGVFHPSKIKFIITFNRKLASTVHEWARLQMNPTTDPNDYTHEVGLYRNAISSQYRHKSFKKAVRIHKRIKGDIDKLVNILKKTYQDKYKQPC